MTPDTTTQWTLEPCLCGNTSCMTQRLTNGKHHIGTIDDPDDALIARAAPELLAALEDARATIVIMRGNVLTEIGKCADPSESRWAGVPDELEKRIKKIDAAIAKVRGAS